MDEMHIFVPGDGLCSTHVTWDDIEKDMQLSLNTSARFGPNKNVKDIGDGKGFMSKILLVDPDWQPQQEELPKNFVVKILTQLAMQKLSSSVSRDKGSFTDLDFMITYEALQKRCHNAEIAAYKQLAKIPSGLLEIPKARSRLSDDTELCIYIDL
ncbi:hypothetical protein Q1695_003721 [Nippostrongylus brasiliensis]|nr:hypothetical protein Q1695_003721 [Nippostrongylus brasiliensis]